MVNTAPPEQLGDESEEWKAGYETRAPKIGRGGCGGSGAVPDRERRGGEREHIQKKENTAQCEQENEN